jgi:hypothetical protein
MNAKSKEVLDDLELQRASGIPPRGKIGASRNELIALALALTLLVVIAVSFWFEAH